MEDDETKENIDREPLYFISIAARLVGMHVQTLRKYERLGFVEPPRSGGNVRLYSPDDIRRLRQIKYLVGELGINISGTERILEITEVVLRMERRLHRERSPEELRRALSEEMQALKALLGISC